MVDGAAHAGTPDMFDFYQLDEGIIQLADIYASAIQRGQQEVFHGPPSALPEDLQLLAEASAEYAEQEFSVTAVSRISRDMRPNGAFGWHTSPARRSGKIAVATLRGPVVMEVDQADAPIRCYSGLLLIMDGTIRRRFVRPNTYTESRMVTFGNDTTPAG